MDNRTDSPKADSSEEPRPQVTAETILAAEGLDLHGKDRSLQRRWYNGLSEEDQADVRDKLRSEILRIRSELGRRTETIYPLPIRRRDHG